MDRELKKKLVFRLIEEAKAIRDFKNSLNETPSYKDGSFSGADESKLHQAAMLGELMNEELTGFYFKTFVD